MFFFYAKSKESGNDRWVEIVDGVGSKKKEKVEEEGLKEDSDSKQEVLNSDTIVDKIEINEQGKDIKVQKVAKVSKKQTTTKSQACINSFQVLEEEIIEESYLDPGSAIKIKENNVQIARGTKRRNYGRG
ncbi:hypothetical protein ACH5RR_000667 [Cinchona calisaya]|uniref:Uncharacterized protein n=1 Tax=Cinchona calisaya TaxID=153742 RepID=A0ABD3B1I2_9GENT